MRDGDGDLLVGDQVFQFDLGGFVQDLGAAVVAVLLADFFQLLDDHAAQLFLAAQDSFVLGDAVAHFLQLADDLVDGEAREAVQLQFQDGVGLLGVERMLGRFAGKNDHAWEGWFAEGVAMHMFAT